MRTRFQAEKWIYGLTLSAMSMSNLLIGPVMGSIYDRTHQTKAIIIILLSFQIGGKYMHTCTCTCTWIGRYSDYILTKPLYIYIIIIYTCIYIYSTLTLIVLTLLYIYTIYNNVLIWLQFHRYKTNYLWVWLVLIQLFVGVALCIILCFR